MREILFRAKDKKTDKWIYGDLIDREADKRYLKYNILEHKGISSGVYKVKVDTEGQYTGIDDKNGVRVFEADILKVKDRLSGGEMEFMGVVEFKDGSFVIVNDEMTHYRWIDYEIEVIGNKFDNPELLEA